MMGKRPLKGVARAHLGQRRWRVAVLHAVLVAGCSPLYAQGSSNAALTQATALVREGRYDAALRLISKALSTQPSDPRLRTVQGIAYSLKGEEDHALEAFHAALVISPAFAPALQGEATLLARQHDPAVIPVLQAILKIHPGDGTALEMLGLAEAQAGNCASALQAFASLGPALDEKPQLLQHKAACQLETKDLPGAVDTFGQVHHLLPNDPASTYDLAVAQSEAGDLPAAADTLSPLLAHAPDLDTMLLAADVYEQQGKTPRAVELLRQAIVADPMRSEAYVRFAELCMAHESYQAGVDMLNAGVARQPHEAKLYLARGLLYGGMAQYDKAEADFQTAQRNDPHHGTGAYGVGLIEAQRNNPEQALTTVRVALTAHPEDAQLHFLLARLLLEAGAKPDSPPYAEATRSVQEAVHLMPNMTGARDLLAKIYLETGKPVLAVEQCRAALAVDPDDSNARYRLMRSLRATGDSAAAQQVGRQIAAEHQQAREQETDRLRYRIEEATPVNAYPAKTPSETPAAPETKQP